MNFIDTLSIRLKLLLIIMMASLVGLLLSLGSLYIYDRHKILENLVNQGLVLSTRGVIEVLDLEGLNSLADM